MTENVQDDRTAARGYLKPHPANRLQRDAYRLRDALDLIDVDVAGLLIGLRAVPGNVDDKIAAAKSTIEDDIAKARAASSVDLANAISGLTSGAPDLLNTFAEVAAKLASDDSLLTSILSALAVRVRFDAAQSLSAEQQTQGRGNIGAQAALGYTPVQQGTGVGQSTNAVKIGWSTAGVVKVTVDATDFGRVWLDSQVTAGDITGKLGFTPVINHNGTSYAVGLAWDNAGKFPNIIINGSGQGGVFTTSNLTKWWLDNQAGQTLYGTANLTAGQIGAILGYAPARPSLALRADTGGLNDLSASGRGYVNGITFTATATSMLFEAYTSFQNNTSGAAGYSAYLGVTLVDNTTGGEVAAAAECPVGLTYGQGPSQAQAAAVYGALVVGRSYSIKPYVYKTSTGAVIATNTISCLGINL